MQSRTFYSKLAAFSLLELMIVLTIMAILAAIAIPNYQLYIKKAKFSAILSQIVPYKTAVEICAEVLGGLAKLNHNCGTPGQNEIPPDYLGSNSQNNYIASIKTHYQAPKVYITAITKGLGQAYSYILSGRYSTAHDQVEWQIDANSTCLAAGLCRN